MAQGLRTGASLASPSLKEGQERDSHTRHERPRLEATELGGNDIHTVSLNVPNPLRSSFLLRVEIDSYNPHAQKVEAGESEVLVHLCLQWGFLPSLG